MAKHRLNVIGAVGAGILVASAGVALAADKEKAEIADNIVRMKNGAKFPVLGAKRQGNAVFLLVPYEDIESIGGEKLPAPVIAGEKAPSFTVKDLDGKEIRIPAAGKPTLLQFWASWCPFCRKDIENLREIHSAYAPHGLQVIGVSIDQDVDKLKAFLAEQPLPYPVVVSPNGDAHVHDAYDVSGLPTYYMVDAKGIVAQSIAGSLKTQAAHAEELKKAIRGIMKEAGLSLPPEMPVASEPASADSEKR